MRHYYRDGTEVSSGAATGKGQTLNWKRGGIASDGRVDIDSFYLSRIFSSAIHVNGEARLSVPSSYQINACYYSKLDVDGFAGSSVGFSNAITVTGNKYVMVQMKQTEGQTIEPSAGDSLVIEGDYTIATFSDKAPSVQVAWKIENVRRLSEAILSLPVGYPLLGTRVQAARNCYGIPYSAVNITDGYVGVDVSLYTYLSALSNPRSIIYSEYYADDSWRGCMYGIDCSSLVSAGWGLHDVHPTPVLRSHSDFSRIDRMDIRIGDFLLGTGHAEAIVYIDRDEHGRIAFVGVNDAWKPLPRHRYMFWSDFIQEYAPARYARLDDGIFSSPNAYAFLDDPAESDGYSFPDIMPYRGDKCIVKAGSDVQIQVLNSSGYSSIEVYKDGAKIDTKTSVADFTISAAAVGKYEVKMIGTGKTSSCFFHAASISCSVDGDDVAFTFDGVTPYSVSAFKQLYMNGTSIEGSDKQMIHYISTAEQTAGKVSVPSFITYASSEQGRIRVKGYDEYGTIFAEHDFAQ